MQDRPRGDEYLGTDLSVTTDLKCDQPADDAARSDRERSAAHAEQHVALDASALSDSKLCVGGSRELAASPDGHPGRPIDGEIERRMRQRCGEPAAHEEQQPGDPEPT